MQFSREAIETLESYNWPGNVRELENLVQRACVLASGNVLLATDLPFDQGGPRDEERSKLERAARRFINAAEEEGIAPVEVAMRQLVEAALKTVEDDDSAAAKLLGITETELKKHHPSSVASKSA